MSLNAVARYSLAVQRLQQLAKGLRAIADGETVRAANVRIEAQMQRIVDSKLPPHRDTGNAEAIVTIIPDAHGIALRQPKYLRYQGEPRAAAIARRAEAKASPKRTGIAALLFGRGSSAPRRNGRTNWWPFARGIPPFVLKQAAEIYAEETRKRLER